MPAKKNPNHFTERELRDYLSALLPGLADAPMRRLPTLTPTAWAAQRQ